MQKKTKKITRASRQNIGYAYIAIWIIGFLVFKFYPFMSSLFYSFTNYNLFKESVENIGFANYEKIVDTAKYLKSYIVTFKYAFMTVPLKLLFALFIAYLLNFKIKGINLFRTAYYIPSILGGSVAIAVLWQFLFQNEGLVNTIIGLFGVKPVNWLGSPDYAASIDGAGKFTQFLKITIPLITPVIFYNLVTQLCQAFQEFNGPFMITKGGPLGSTTLISILIYQNAFKTYDMGLASAMAWLLFLIVAVLTAVSFISQKHWVYYGDEER